MGKPVDPVARRNELRKQGASPKDAHQQAMDEAREASGHGRRQDQK
jgi:hypothetical protein